MNQDQPKSTLDIALECLTEALVPHFKGKNAEDRLNEAAGAALASISHLLTVRETVKKRPLGATVMTEQASGNIRPGITPRSL